MSALPPAFAALEPFVTDWALTGSAARAARRNASTTAERESFYAAIAPLLSAALDLLDSRVLAAFDPCEQRLMDLCLMAAHVAPAIEALGPDEAAHAPHRAAMVITRTPAGA
jgi:hypothetical protein